MIDQAIWEQKVLERIGGYNDLVRALLSLFRTWGTRQQPDQATINKILLKGRPGSGKTALALALAETSGLPYHVLNATDVFQTEEGATETKLRQFFDKPQQGDSILVVDEVDILACALDKQKSGLDTRILSVMQSCIDKLPTHVFLLAMTNRVHAIDASFLRSGRFDTSFELTMTSAAQRQPVLARLLQDLPFSSSDDQRVLVSQLAQRTHGFEPSDLQSLCTQIVLALVKQEQVTGVKPNITWSLLETCLAATRPAGMHAFTTPVPTVLFSDLFGLDRVIHDIKASVITPFEHPERYHALGITAPRGILLHGPPGTGKTMVCCALARESGINYIFVDSTQLRSKVVGESEKNIANLFAHARSNAPCIIFIDQIDILLPKRGTGSSSENTSDRIVTGFLTEMDGLLTRSSAKNGARQMDIMVVATTNRINVMDDAVLRPGRFDEHIHIDLPDAQQRAAILQGFASKMPLELTTDDMDHVVTNTDGWTGADFDNLLREAAMQSLREDRNAKKIAFRHLSIPTRIK
ncbi:P-loop containing nucleoside triphosphate hydrolase protein [Gongronella butleri]|nr:P-loop containing nucleoside triphosphate hydrolase protein [Gongronella butleri]